MSSKRPVVWLFLCFVVLVSSSSINPVGNNSGSTGDELSRMPELGNDSRITNDQLRQRCDPVPHDALWRRLQISSAVPDDGPWEDDDDVETGGQTETSALRNTDSDIDYRRRLDVSGTNSSVVPDTETPDHIDATQDHRHTRNAWKHGGRHRGRRRHRKPDGKRRQNGPLIKRNRDNDYQYSKSSQPKEFKRSSWHCRLEKRWKRMPPGVFPTYIQTGTCRRQSTCMLGLYECRPRRYRIKVLQRVGQTGNNSDRCSPLANIGATVQYEETWHMVERKVVVGCECSRKRVTGSYYPAENG